MAFSQGVFKNSLWQTSILFELVQSGDTVRFFSLPHPPESFDLVQGQRTNRTKTFGGVLEDDYGLDNARLTLSGSLGGTDRWNYVDATDLKTSEGEGIQILFAFFDRIIRYKEGLDLSDLGDFSLKVYLLWLSRPSFKDSIALQASFTQGKILAFEASLDEFKISQEKSAPFAMKYNLELFLFRRIGTFNPDSLRTAPLPAGPPQIIKMIRNLQNQINNLKAAFKNTLASLENKITEWLGYTDEMVSLMEDIVSLPSDLAGIATGAINRSISRTVTGLADAINRIFNLPALLVQKMIGVSADILQLVYTLKNSFAELGTKLATGNVVTAAIQGGNQGSSSFMDSYLTGTPEVLSLKMYENLIQGAISDTMTAQAQLAAQVMKLDTPAIPLTQDANGKTIKIYGTSEIPLKKGDTFESLSFRIFGDPDLGFVLAAFSGLSSLDDLPVGTSLKIPLLKKSDKKILNQVYGDDPLGSDLTTDEVGDFLISPNGDFSNIQGQENLAQGLTNTLNTEKGTYLRNLSLGLASDLSILPSALAQNIQDAVMQDPRVLSVSNLYFSSSGDSLIVSFDAECLSQSANLQVKVHG